MSGFYKVFWNKLSKLNFDIEGPIFKLKTGPPKCLRQHWLEHIISKRACRTSR